MLQKSTVNIEEAIVNINIGLVQIGISDFSIAKHNDTLYKIVRLGNSAADFSSLSEGEKMIISFLYFCELCKGKRNASEVPGKKVVVIDDPISSLSHIFVFNIGRLIKSEFFDSANFEQVFVLTHSLYFFYELADSNHKKRNEHQKLFRLFKNDAGSQILKMSYEEVQNDYHSYWSVVTDSAQPPALIANCMRNIVEYFFNFVQKQDLSNVIQMPALQGNKHQAFCRYINRESHSLGQNIFDYKEFDYESFREGLKLVFEVTGYIEHHDKMIQVLGK
jgi:wobble nucleotide-excising tRNase